MLQLRKASRKKAKIKIQIGGSSGSGKTYSSLLLAYGMTNDWDKIAVIDTENRSADLYADLGEYNVITLDSFTPKKYIEAITLCEKSGIEVCIIDSSTHAWEWAVEYNQSQSGNSFTNWGNTMKIFNEFKNKMLQSNMHIISTVRKKEEYAMEDGENGKKVVVKKGLKEIQKGEMSYEFTIVFDVDQNHQTKSSKDRTGIFVDELPFVITPETGMKILEWCNKGVSEDESVLQGAIAEINAVENIEDLKKVIEKYPELKNNFEYIELVKQKNKELKV